MPLILGRGSSLLLSKAARVWAWLVIGGSLVVYFEDSGDCKAASPAAVLVLGGGWLVIRFDLVVGIAALNDSKVESPSGTLALPAPSLLSPRRYFLLIWGVTAWFRNRGDWREDESTVRRVEPGAAVGRQETIAFCVYFT
jgi:hypothetical protein